MKEARGQVISLSARAGESLSDVALLAACAAGDVAALGPLFDRYGDDTARFLGRLAHVSAQEVEDLVHDVFLAVLKSAKRYERTASVRTWILAIAANLARQAARSAVRARGFVARAVSEAPAPSARPDEEATQRRLVAALGPLIAGLPHDLRVAFVMADIEAVPGVEAARALGIPTGTFYRRLHEARTRLRQGLDGDAV